MQTDLDSNWISNVNVQKTVSKLAGRLSLVALWSYRPPPSPPALPPGNLVLLNQVQDVVKNHDKLPLTLLSLGRKMQLLRQALLARRHVSNRVPWGGVYL